MKLKSLIKKSLLISFALFITSCSTISPSNDPRDPLESYNRLAFGFNDNVDQYLLKPIAKGYDAISPMPVQKAVHNFFSNLDDVIVIFNDILQLKPLQLASDMSRFIVNSTLGLAGFIDWASDMGLEKHREDFGQTLGYWGVPEGPYFVIPFWGPSTIRDTAGLLIDSSQFDPTWQQLENGYPLESREGKYAWGLTSIKTIDIRASLLTAESILEEAALDRYSFIREAYFQQRLNLIYDGNPPIEEAEFNEDELFDF